MWILSDALLEARGTTEVTSAQKPLAQKPPSIPDADAREVEDMVSSMLRDSPTPDAEQGSEKLPEEGGGEKRPEETPTGKLVMPFLQFSFCSRFIGFGNPSFSLDSHNQGNTVEKIEKAPCIEAGPVVGASTSPASPGSALPQEEKLKLAHKLLTVSTHRI